VRLHLLRCGEDVVRRLNEQFLASYCGTRRRTTTDQLSLFAVIAKRLGFDAIAPFLPDRHPKMSDMSLTRLEATDLAGSIGMLAK
jgi:hypothetical protein